MVNMVMFTLFFCVFTTRFIKHALISLTEHLSQKTHLLTYVPIEDSNQPSVQSDQSRRCPREETTSLAHISESIFMTL